MILGVLRNPYQRKCAKLPVQYVLLNIACTHLNSNAMKFLFLLGDENKFLFEDQLKTPQQMRNPVSLLLTPLLQKLNAY